MKFFFTISIWDFFVIAGFHFEKKIFFTCFPIEKQSVSVLGIVFIIVAACVGYCILFAVIMFLYKR